MILPLLLVLTQQPPLAGLDPYIAQAIKDWRVPGLAMVVVKDDSVVFIKGYGVRELGKPDPVTVHTRFGNMSTTKAFTAMLVAMLADSGKLSFDDPVSKYEPEVQFADPYVTREIRVRDLLTHRVGFADPDYLWGTSGLDFATIARRLRLVPVQTSFRSRFQYNNVTYALAGDVAAHAAGRTWQSLLHTRILGPLGMTETAADASELQAAGITEVTAPHGIVRDTVRVLPASLDGIIAPAGAIFSTATDMAKWLRFVLDSGKVAGRRLVSAPNFAELFRPQQIVQRPFYPTARLTHPHFQAYGLGWILQDYRGEFIAIHTGSIEGRSAIVGLIPDRRLGLAILTNLDHSELRHALMYTVFDRFIGPSSPAHDWSAEMRAMYGRLADSTRAARQALESKDRDRVDHDRGVRERPLVGSGVAGRRAGRFHGPRIWRDLRAQGPTLHADGRARRVRRGGRGSHLLESRAPDRPSFLHLTLWPAGATGVYARIQTRNFPRACE